MQTFMPYDSFYESLNCLDDRRLGKQRVEAMQIIITIEDPAYGWQHHTAVEMWRNDLEALKLYHNMAIKLWIQRGKRNNMDYLPIELAKLTRPTWMGGSIHKSHKLNLMAKDWRFYSQYGWRYSPFYPYHWPKRSKR